MKSLDFEKVSVEDARKALERPSKEGEPPKTHVRTSSGQNPILLDATVAWLAELPYAVRPNELASRFPRIANSISELWRRVARCEEYLDTLVVDQRGDRKGFPPAVAQELAALRSYYAELHPSSTSTWDFERDK
jgi:hypothetical protein